MSKWTLLLLIVPFVGCEEKKFGSQPEPANEHSVLVLPPESQKRIDDLTADVANLEKGVNQYVADVKAYCDQVDREVAASKAFVARVDALEAKFHQHPEELPCPPDHNHGGKR